MISVDGDTVSLPAPVVVDASAQRIHDSAARNAQLPHR
jgi:hypothetical protein